jgi:hypothetical protein
MAQRDDPKYPPVVLSLSVFMIALGLITGSVILNLKLRWSQPVVQPSSGALAGQTGRPPGDTAPAIVGALVQRIVNPPAVRGTILDFARRGHLALASTASQSRHGSIEFLGYAGVAKSRIQLLSEPSPHYPHESAMWSALRSRAGDHGIIPDIEMQNMMATPSWLSPVAHALRADLVAAGYFTEDRRGLPLQVVGAACGVAAIVVAAAAVPDRNWGVLPGILLLVFNCVFALFAASVMPATTVAGNQAALPWRAYLEYLAQADSRADMPVDVESAIPYLVACASTARFAQRINWMAIQGYHPDWFRSPRMDRDFSDRDPDLYALWCDSEVINGSFVNPSH